jgi:PEGA domain
VPLFRGLAPVDIPEKVSHDGFGTRTLCLDPDNGDAVGVLSFAASLAGTHAFAAATGERVARLARVRHAMYARVRKIERPAADALLLYSDHVPGWRLSDVLTFVERERWRLDISTVLALLRQLLPAVALFSRHQRDATIGTIGPERLILTPQGRLVIAEFVLAPGLEKVQYSPERLWRDFRVAMPPTASLSKIPPSADVVGIGIVALSLLLGRRLRDDEHLFALGPVFDTLTETSGDTTRRLSGTFRTWISRALQFDAQASYQTTQEAQVAFEEMLAHERSYVTSSAQLNQFVMDFERDAGSPPVPSAVSVPVSAPAPAPVWPAPAAPIAPAVPGAPAAPAAPIAPVWSAPVAPVAPIAPVAPAAPIAPAAPATFVAAAAPDERAPVGAAVLAPPESSPAPFWRKHALLAAGAIALIEAVAIAWLMSGGGAASPDRGELVVQSRPVAARVTIDGEERGITPYTSDLSPGSHVLEVRVGRSEPRVIPLMIRGGMQTSLYVELQSVATVGGLEVRTEPANARVIIGGQNRGVTPLVLRDLPPGEMEVVVRLGSREVRQTVRIEPGITSQLVVPMGR